MHTGCLVQEIPVFSCEGKAQVHQPLPLLAACKKLSWVTLVQLSAPYSPVQLQHITVQCAWGLNINIPKRNQCVPGKCLWFGYLQVLDFIFFIISVLMSFYCFWRLQHHLMGEGEKHSQLKLQGRQRMQDSIHFLCLTPYSNMHSSCNHRRILNCYYQLDFFNVTMTTSCTMTWINGTFHRHTGMVDVWVFV